MTKGLTFTDYNEALEYKKNQYYQENNNVAIKKVGPIYKAYITGKIQYRDYNPVLLRDLGLEERTLEPNRHFHITEKNLGQSVTLSPNYSELGDTVNFPGVSFAPTLKQALDALYPEVMKIGEKSGIIYVYTPTKRKQGFIPEESDVRETGEIKSPEAIEAKLVKKIQFTPTGRDKLGNWEYNIEEMD